ncbi:MAG: tetratricopeptide repeat protein, partial [Planctomycetaceae bacterium]
MGFRMLIVGVVVLGGAMTAEAQSERSPAARIRAELERQGKTLKDLTPAQRKRYIELRRAERERAVAQRQREERARWTRYINQWRKELDAATEEIVRGQKPGVSEDAGFRIQRALFHLGVGYAETERWPQAVETFERLLSKHPNGPWHGEGLVRLIDVQLVGETDLPAATRRIEQGLVWTEQVSLERTPVSSTDAAGDDAAVQQTHEGRPVGVERDADEPPFDQPVPRPTWQVAHDLFQRAGLLRYLEGDDAAAVELMQTKATPLSYPRTRPQTGIERLMAGVYFKAYNGLNVLPESVRQGDPTATACMMLI